MHKDRIIRKMRGLELIIHYHFNTISYLSKAMCATKIDIEGGDNHKEYQNEGLATEGDTILKSVIADYLYRSGVTTKGKITEVKSKLENNDVLYEVSNELGIINYAYHETYFYSDNPPLQEQVANPKHSPYVEAIVGAVFYDSNYDTTKRWILKWLLRILQ